MAKSVGLDVPWRLALTTAILSNIVSNVPAVLALRPFIPTFPDPFRAWLVVAMASTLAGNLTLIGSVANLIVAERAQRRRADRLLGLFQGRAAADARHARGGDGVAVVALRPRRSAKWRRSKPLESRRRLSPRSSFLIFLVRRFWYSRAAAANGSEAGSRTWVSETTTKCSLPSSISIPHMMPPWSPA